MMLPLAMIRKLRMRLQEKIVLALVFGLVLVDISFATLSFVYFMASLESEALETKLWNALWANLDPIVAVLVCTLPCYRSVVSPKRTQPISDNAISSYSSSKFSGVKGMMDHEKKSVNDDAEMAHLDTVHLPSHEATS